MAGRRAMLLGVLVSVVAVALAGCTTPSGPAGKPELKVGTILPMTGSLGVFGPPGRAAIEAAAAQVNGAADATYRVRLVHEDSQTETGAGAAAAQKLRTDGASVIVGAYASGVSKAVLEVTRPNRIVQVSPASTSPEFTSIQEGRPEAERFFFRTAPSDALQGNVAGAYAISKGWTRVVVLHGNNPYGNGLRVTFTQAFQGAEASTQQGAAARLVSPVPFEDRQTSYDSVLQQAFAGCTGRVAACPSAVFFIGYPTEATQMVKDWWARSEWRHVPWLFSEGVQDQGFFDGLRTAGVDIGGFEGTAPVGVGPGFAAFERILGATPTLFQAHAYDALVLVALAAEKAQSTQGAALREAMRAVSGPPGEQVGPGDVARAIQLLKQGQDIDYEGAAGSQNLDALGDVTSSYEIYIIQAGGRLGRKCLVPEADAVARPARLPAACTQAMPPAPPPPPPPTNESQPGNTTLNFTLRESGGVPPKLWSIDPRNATAPAGRALTFGITSAAGSAAPHNMTLIRGTAGERVGSYDPTLSAGQSAAFEVSGLAAGSYTYYCAVTGHRELGMEGTLTVA